MSTNGSGIRVQELCEALDAIKVLTEQVDKLMADHKRLRDAVRNLSEAL